MLGLLSLRRRKSYDSPQQAVMTFSHYSKDLLRPLLYTSGLQIRSNEGQHPVLADLQSDRTECEHL